MKSYEELLEETLFSMRNDPERGQRVHQEGLFFTREVVGVEHV